MIRRLSLLLVLSLGLAGCASGPLRTEGVANDVTPAGVRSDPVATGGKTVLWGGKIVRAHNLPERTRLEIVAYPLDSRSQVPQLDDDSTGRFRAYVDGYLETAVYAPGRRITVRGRLDGVEQGQIDEADYTFPVVEVDSSKLWPQRRSGDDGPNLHFGFGFLFGG